MAEIIPLYGFMRQLAEAAFQQRHRPEPHRPTAQSIAPMPPGRFHPVNDGGFPPEAA